MNEENAVSAVSADLHLAVRRLLNDPAARVLEMGEEAVAWRVVSEVTQGLVRLRGEAFSNGRVVPWSLVVKTARPDASGDETWRREVFAYTSGVLRDTPNVRAPRLLHVAEPAPDRTSLWLEDVPDDTTEVWPTARHVLVARHLGEWNAAHPVIGEPPAWLWRDWLAGLDSRREPAAMNVSNELKSPLVREALGEDIGAVLDAVNASFDAWAERLARLPLFLAHLDPGRFNLRAHEDRTVVLDFQMLGVGPLGTDLAMAHFLNLGRFYADPAEAPALIEAALHAYVQGSGGECEDVRFASSAIAAMRAAIVVRLLAPELAAGDLRRFASWGEKRGLNGREAARWWGQGMRALLEV